MCSIHLPQQQQGMGTQYTVFIVPPITVRAALYSVQMLDTGIIEYSLSFELTGSKLDINQRVLSTDSVTDK